MIAAYVGELGSGKTLSAVTDTIKRARRTGFPIVSTVPITADGITCIPVESWDQVLELEDCHLLLDEIVVVASSRETSSLRPDVVAGIGALRHVGVTVSWTAPAWGRADVTIREITQKVVHMRAFLGSDDGGAWARTGVSVRRDWRGTLQEGGDFPSRANGQRAPFPKFVRLRSLEGWGKYPTRMRVRPLDGFGGTCPECHLPKRREFCHCGGRH